jgi:hypothetical protein
MQTAEEGRRPAPGRGIPLGNPLFSRNSPRKAAFHPCHGFSFVEMCVSVGIASILLLFMYRFLVEANFQMKTGFHNLESLDQARLAVNYLRRDFAAACPFISSDTFDTESHDPEHEFAAKNLIRQTVFFQDFQFADPKIRPQLDLDRNQSYPLRYSPDETSHLLFFRFRFDETDGKALSGVEQVEYLFDPQAKELTRRLNGRSVVFTGMEQVEFRFFLPDWASATIMLRVHLKVRNIPDHLKDKMTKTWVRLSTTVNSHFISSNLFDPHWNFEGYQKKL